MRLLILRHAIAEDREDFRKRTQKEDRFRPLTEKGRKRLKLGLKGLRKLLPKVDLLVSSDFSRADQTAKVFKKKYGLNGIEYVESLRPSSDPEEFISWLNGVDHSAVIAAVGHEPHLSRLASTLANGDDGSSESFSLQKGGVCLLEFKGSVERGKGRLRCFLTPSQLRRIGLLDRAQGKI